MPITRTATLVLLLALIGAVLSGLLLLQHYNQAHENALVEMMCGGGELSGCDAVDESSYSSLFGIPLSAYGIFFYCSLALVMGISLAGDAKTRESAASLVFIVTLLAFVADIVLLGIQMFVIKALCNLCLSTYAVTFVILLLLWKYKSLAPGRVIRSLLGKPDGKILFASGIAGSVIIAAGVIAADIALSYRDPDTFDQRLTEIEYDEFMSNEVESLDVAGAPMMGAANAPITIVLYSDFLCPWCRQVAQNFQQKFHLWRDRVAVYYKSFPLDQVCNPTIGETLHRGSCWAALGGVCAQEQGKFWEYHDRIFMMPPRRPDGRSIIDLAYEVGIDTAKMTSCMLSTAMQGKVRNLIKEASSHDIASTPVIFINGRRLPRIGYLSSVLKREAERLGLRPLEGIDE